MPLDAAIVFSDIMVPLAGVGIDVRIEPGRGPVVDTPVRSAADVARIRPLEPEQDVPEALEAIRLLRKELSVPLVGFAGAPFTLASYLVEGGPSRNHERTKALMLGDPQTWDALMRALVAVVEPHLRAQVAAGAQALQVFDSWVGALDPDDYRVSVMPHMRGLFDRLIDLDVPLIHFGVGTGELLAAAARSRRRRDRHRLANPVGRGLASRRWRRERRVSRATSTPPRCWRPGPPSKRRRAVCWSGRADGTGTCSTWATGCCPRHRPRRWNGSWTWSTTTTQRGTHVSDTEPGSPSAPIGVLVMAYGTASGPDDIERYYTDIRGGRTPSPEHLQELKDRYAAIGESFPLLDTTRGAGRRRGGATERCERSRR